jgi:hypothetical protein
MGFNVIIKLIIIFIMDFDLILHYNNVINNTNKFIDECDNNKKIVVLKYKINEINNHFIEIKDTLNELELELESKLENDSFDKIEKENKQFNIFSYYMFLLYQKINLSSI